MSCPACGMSGMGPDGCSHPKCPIERKEIYSTGINRIMTAAEECRRDPRFDMRPLPEGMQISMRNYHHEIVPWYEISVVVTKDLGFNPIIAAISRMRDKHGGSSEPL